MKCLNAECEFLFLVMTKLNNKNMTKNMTRLKSTTHSDMYLGKYLLSVTQSIQNTKETSYGEFPVATM